MMDPGMQAMLLLAKKWKHKAKPKEVQDHDSQQYDKGKREAYLKAATELEAFIELMTN